MAHVCFYFEGLVLSADVISCLSGDVTPAPWHDPLIPKLESDDEVKPDPDETPSLDEPGWAVNGMDEVMTLGLSGEYLGSVKAEPIPSSSLHNLEGAREPTSCSSEEFQGEDRAASQWW